jgi:hypothetical protein
MAIDLGRFAIYLLLGPFRALTFPCRYCVCSIAAKT